MSTNLTATALVDNSNGPLSVDADGIFQEANTYEYSYTVHHTLEHDRFIQTGKLKTGWVDATPREMILFCKKEFGCVNPTLMKTSKRRINNGGDRW